jgi:hypothetical protein
MRKPAARTAELLVEEFGDELLVYDQRSDHVHCLNAAVCRVWRACDGKTSVDQLAPGLNLDSELVARALAELEACGLLDSGAAVGVTRREAGARLARMGAAAAAAPLIYSIAAPTPAMAVTPGQCTAVGKCIAIATATSACSAACVSPCACCRLTGCAGASKTWGLCLSASACSTCTTANLVALEAQCNAQGGSARSCGPATNCS